MKPTNSISLGICCVLSLSCGNKQIQRWDAEDPLTPSPPLDAVKTVISVDQVGYHPNAPKYFTLEAATGGGSFVLKRKDSAETVFTGSLQKIDRWDDDRINLRGGSFDQVSAPGDYILSVDGLPDATLIHVAMHPYGNLLRDSIRFFYYQRASLDLPPSFAGIFSRKGGHLDNHCRMHDSTGKNGEQSSAGGWYDAGDFGKYVVNGGVSVATLLGLHTLYPDAVGDDLNLPESGNGKSDLLDEVKFELDWMKTMQDPSDGGVYSKVAGAAWPGMVMPDQDTQPRYIFGKGTASALNFIAVMAQAARVYKDYDPAFARDCLERAEHSFPWTLRNPDLHPPYTSQGSGNYDGGSYADEFFWAIAELFISTRNPNYLKYLTGEWQIGGGINIADFIAHPRITGPADWGMGQWPTTGVTNLAYFSLLTQENQLTASILQQIRQQLIVYADSVLTQIAANPYQTALGRHEFSWGSNGIVANKGVVLGYAYQLTQQKKYLAGMIEILHYLVGRNATGTSFITGFGEHSARFPHHRVSAGDGVEPPVPGMLVGGPNAGRNDGLTYPSNLPEKIYLDDTRSFASNEVAINWNAPMVFMLGIIVRNEDQLTVQAP